MSRKEDIEEALDNVIGATINLQHAYHERQVIYALVQLAHVQTDLIRILAREALEKTE
jgi:hypothetical protein